MKITPVSTCTSTCARATANTYNKESDASPKQIIFGPSRFGKCSGDDEYDTNNMYEPSDLKALSVNDYPQY